MVLPYVYKLTNEDTGEFYFGFRMGNKVSSVNDLGIKYFTSSKYVKPRFAEFKTEIVAEFFDADSAYWFEQSLIEENWKIPGILNKKYQKKRDGSFRFCYSEKSNSPEARAKIGAFFKGKPKSAEHNKKVGDAQRGKTLSEEHRLALCKPKTITSELIMSWEKLKTPNSMSKPRKCSCLICGKETSTNHINRHYSNH
jgi:hypothetical protein